MQVCYTRHRGALLSPGSSWVTKTSTFFQAATSRPFSHLPAEVMEVHSTPSSSLKLTYTAVHCAWLYMLPKITHSPLCWSSWFHWPAVGNETHPVVERNRNNNAKWLDCGSGWLWLHLYKHNSLGEINPRGSLLFHQRRKWACLGLCRNCRRGINFWKAETQALDHLWQCNLEDMTQVYAFLNIHFVSSVVSSSMGRCLPSPPAEDTACYLRGEIWTKRSDTFSISQPGWSKKDMFWPCSSSTLWSPDGELTKGSRDSFVMLHFILLHILSNT